MIMKKKWISVIGISAFIVWLAACSAQGETPVSNQQDSTTEPAKQTAGAPNDDKDSDKENNEQEEKSTYDINLNDDAAVSALVNKQHSLDENYEPDDLVPVDVPTVLENPEVNQLRQVAAEALKDMFDTAAKSDIYLHARSGYRSYQTQVQLFDNYAKKHGVDEANRYSAKPGHSEHQTGLVMDVTSENVQFQLVEEFGETKEGKWLSEHAHEFGFIIRYPKNMEDVTGYIYEPWHIRYLGVDLATEVYESKLTYEEFLVKEGIIHEVNS